MLSGELQRTSGGGWTAAEAATLLRQVMPRTLAVAAAFMANPHKLARMPKSSETGKVGEAWLKRGRSVDSGGLPAGTLLKLGGTAERALARRMPFSQRLTEDMLVLRTQAAPLRCPPDDFSLTVERIRDFPLSLHVDYVVGRDRFGRRSLGTLRIGLHRLSDTEAAILTAHALDCRFLGLEPRDALVSLRDLAIKMGFERRMMGWFAPKPKGVEPPAGDAEAEPFPALAAPARR